MTDERKPCPAPECGAYEGHHPECPLAPLEYKAERMTIYYKEWLEERGRGALERTRLRDLVTLWQGKHALLRHENNKLRAQLKGRVCLLPKGWDWGYEDGVYFVMSPGGQSWSGKTAALALCAAIEAFGERMR